jgi:formate-dependent phosphoribosylglycinamide formyltransferase (GAR transformylase)
MNPKKFHPLYDQAMQLQNKFHGIAGDSNHPAAVAIRREMQNLVQEMEHQKNPHLIEKHIGAIQLEMLQSENAGGTFMNQSQARDFHNNYEKMRKQLRESHYYF